MLYTHSLKQYLKLMPLFQTCLKRFVKDVYNLNILWSIVYINCTCSIS